MSYVVYLDVFLVINIFMDFLILVIARSLIKPRTTLIKCLLGAFISGILSTISLMISYKVLWIRFITSYILICFVMCRVAFNVKGIRNRIKNMCIVYAVTFCLGGGMNVLYYYTSFGFVLNRILSGEYVKTVNIIRFICIALSIYLVTDFLLGKLKNAVDSDKRIYRIRIGNEDKIICANALLDTGNLLFEPISGREVHIIEYEAVKDIVNKEKGFYRVIPFNSVGNERGLLNAVQMEFIEIENGELPCVRFDKPIIALYDKKLTLDGSFEGLLHSSVSKFISS